MNEEAIKVWLHQRFQALEHYALMPPRQQAVIDVLVTEFDLYLEQGNTLYLKGILGELWVACSLNRLMQPAILVPENERQFPELIGVGGPTTYEPGKWNLSCKLERWLLERKPFLVLPEEET